MRIYMATTAVYETVVNQRIQTHRLVNNTRSSGISMLFAMVARQYLALTDFCDDLKLKTFLGYLVFLSLHHPMTRVL
jgi:hypothetical protein